MQVVNSEIEHLRRSSRGVIMREKIIAKAKAGDVVAREALLLEFHDILDRNEMPPACLRVFARWCHLNEARDG